jgi:hypothetical protein
MVAERIPNDGGAARYVLRGHQWVDFEAPLAEARRVPGTKYFDITWLPTGCAEGRLDQARLEELMRCYPGGIRVVEA